MVIGEVVGIHISSTMVVDGKVDARKIKPLARLGYLDYASIEPVNIFPIDRPE